MFLYSGDLKVETCLWLADVWLTATSGIKSGSNAITVDMEGVVTSWWSYMSWLAARPCSMGTWWEGNVEMYSFGLFSPGMDAGGQSGNSPSPRPPPRWQASWKSRFVYFHLCMGDDWGCHQQLFLSINLSSILLIHWKDTCYTYNRIHETHTIHNTIQLIQIHVHVGYSNMSFTLSQLIKCFMTFPTQRHMLPT